MGDRVAPVTLENAAQDVRDLLGSMLGEGVDPTLRSGPGAVGPDGMPADFYPSLALVPGGVVAFHRMVSRVLAEEGRPLPAPLRELVVLRQAIVSDCRSIFFQHVEMARAVGLSEEKIAAVKGWATADVYDEIERAVMAATDELIGVGRIQDETIGALKRHLSDAAVAEVVYVAAVFDMVSTLVRGLHLGDDTDVADRLVEVPKAVSS